MLVVISDLHFSDGTAGEHNLPARAFTEVFLSDIASLAKDKGCQEIKILLLGDIIDLIRSELWFGVKRQDRPWGVNGLADIPIPRSGSVTERQCFKILGQVSDGELTNPKSPPSLEKDTVLSKNWKTFKFFRELKSEFEKKGINTSPQIIYVPGNHDRLCNLYPSVRKELQKLLGITISTSTVDGDPKGDWRFRYDFMEEAYGVYARHGHQYDPWNYASTNLGFEDHLKVPVGDVITTEFAAKIPWTAAAMKSKHPEITDGLIKNLKDIDNVRPMSSVLEWIYYRIKKEDSGKIRDAIERILDKVVKQLLDIELIQKWRSPETHWDEAIRALSSPWLRWLSKGLVDLLKTEDLLPLFMGMDEDAQIPEKDIYTQAAYSQERIWRTNKNIQFILYGHSHVPLQRPLDSDEREVIYLNTGTWRNRIYKTVGLDRSPDFIDLKQMTYTIFYRRDEDLKDKEAGTLSFDVWTGAKKKNYKQEA
jgi:UDP-2,3-diacylglucosamine pyrophosphatase LpxH